MSTCISRHGEYGSHILNDDFVCTLCGVLDEDGLIEELNGARRALRRIADKLDIAQAAEPSLIADLMVRYVDAAAVNLAGALEAADAAHERLSTLSGIADGERELRAAQMERERDEALAEVERLRPPSGEGAALIAATEQAIAHITPAYRSANPQADAWEATARRACAKLDQATADCAAISRNGADIIDALRRAESERDALWDATGIAHDRPVEFITGAIENMVDTSRITRTQLRPQLARAEADANELRRELDALQRAVTAATGNDGSETDIEAIQRLGAECARAINAEIDRTDERDEALKIASDRAEAQRAARRELEQLRGEVGKIADYLDESRSSSSLKVHEVTLRLRAALAATAPATQDGGPRA